MASPPSPEPPDVASLTFEQATEELEALIERIESGELGLEASLVARRRGEALIKRCRGILDVAEQELEQVSATDDDGDEGREASEP